MKSRAPILIAGGDQDPHLEALAGTCERKGLPIVRILIGLTHRPRLHWDFESRQLLVNGVAFAPRAAFVRHDIFCDLKNPKPAMRHAALAWYTTLAAYLQLSQARIPNRLALFRANSKIVTLDLARSHGLRIPHTWITNDQQWVVKHSATDRAIAKPVNGGCYTRMLQDLVPTTEHKQGAYASPTFVQQQLGYPELRVFVIGNEAVSFQVESSTIDYRSSSASRVTALATTPKAIRAPLLALCRHLDLDFAAADFKTDPETGHPIFLEVNDSPMFAAFDGVSNRAVSSTLALWLAGRDPKDKEEHSVCAAQTSGAHAV